MFGAGTDQKQLLHLCVEDNIDEVQTMAGFRRDAAVFHWGQKPSPLVMSLRTTSMQIRCLNKINHNAASFCQITVFTSRGLSPLPRDTMLRIVETGAIVKTAGPSTCTQQKCP